MKRRAQRQHSNQRSPKLFVCGVVMLAAAKHNVSLRASLSKNSLSQLELMCLRYLGWATIGAVFTKLPWSWAQHKQVTVTQPHVADLHRGPPGLKQVSGHSKWRSYVSFGFHLGNFKLSNIFRNPICLQSGIRWLVGVYIMMNRLTVHVLPSHTSSREQPHSTDQV